MWIDCSPADLGAHNLGDLPDHDTVMTLALASDCYSSCPADSASSPAVACHKVRWNCSCHLAFEAHHNFHNCLEDNVAESLASVEADLESESAPIADPSLDFPSCAAGSDCTRSASCPCHANPSLV